MISIVAGMSANIINPSGVSASQGGPARINVFWVDNSTREDNYEVEYQINSGGYTAFSSSPYAADTVSANETGVSWSVSDNVDVRVRGTNDQTSSDWIVDSFTVT